MPRITVLTSTNRIGGLDVLFESLKRQTFQDFELVLVDALHRYRAEIVAEKAKQYPFPVQHLEPLPNGFPRSEQSKAFNCGIVHARSPIVCYECDYTWLHEDTLATHADFHDRHPGCCWMGDFYYADLPPHRCPDYSTDINPSDNEGEFMRQTTQVALCYAADLDQGLLNHVLWSVFLEPPEPPFSINYRHEKKGQEEFDGDWNYFSFKNESLPLEALLAINGHDEDYDGAHAKNDAEVAYRLRESGIKLWSGPRGKGAVTCLNPRDVLACRAMDRPRTTNDALCYVTKKAEMRVPVNTGRSLRAEHEAAMMGEDESAKGSGPHEDCHPPSV